MQIACHQCRHAMDVPDQAAHLGGTFSCPFCRAVNTVAPVATPVTNPGIIGSKAKSTDNRPGVVALTVLVAGALFLLFPLVGVLLGLALGAWGVYLIAKGGVSPLQLIFRNSTQTKAMAVGTLAIGIFFTTCGVMGFKNAAEEKAKAEREAQQRAEDEARKAAEAQERREQAMAAVTQGKQLLADGNVEGAQESLAKAREFDSEVEGAEQLSKDIKAELHRRALATLPSRLTTIQEKTRVEAWKEAGKECRAAKAIDAEYEGISAACAPVEEQLLLIGRKEAVANAEAVSADADKCQTPLALSEAWEELKKIPSDDPSFKKAKRVASKLEKCRKKTERAFDKGLRDIMVSQREAYVEKLDRAMLESGMDARVTLGGKHKDKLKIKWVLIGRATAHEMAHEGGILVAAEKIGFKRVTFTDGYYESFYYDLEPQSEAEGGKKVLASMGLDKPLKL